MGVMLISLRIRMVLNIIYQVRISRLKIKGMMMLQIRDVSIMVMIEEILTPNTTTISVIRTARCERLVSELGKQEMVFRSEQSLNLTMEIPTGSEIDTQQDLELEVKHMLRKKNWLESIMVPVSQWINISVRSRKLCLFSIK